MAAPDATDAEDYESHHVHDVYQQIAPHFSSTRYKPWPLVQKFLSSLIPGSIGIDAGCGNGKYLAAAPAESTIILGSDRSENLIEIAARHAQCAQRSTANCVSDNWNRKRRSTKGPQISQRKGDGGSFCELHRIPFNAHVALVADSLFLPHPSNRFDFAISIALIHHFSTRERRIAAIEEVLRCLRPVGKQFGLRSTQEEGSGKALIFVWALEQNSSRRGWDEGDGQDVMVPWVTKTTKIDGHGTNSIVEEKTYERYYHLYRKGELEEDIKLAGGTPVEIGYEKDNWWAIAMRSQVS